MNGSQTADGGKWRTRLTPADGSYATTEGLLRFVCVLLEPRLLSPEMASLLLQGTVEMRPGVLYAYGLQDKTVNGQRVIGHGGNAPGVRNLMNSDVATGSTLIVLSNTDLGCLPVREHFRESSLA